MCANEEEVASWPCTLGGFCVVTCNVDRSQKLADNKHSEMATLGAQMAQQFCKVTTAILNRSHHIPN